MAPSSAMAMASKSQAIATDSPCGCARDHPPLLNGSRDQRIISTGVEFDIYLRLRVAKLIAAGAMHLRHRAKA